jgi:hypothetical protein
MLQWLYQDNNKGDHMKLQIKEIVNGECEAFTKVYGTSEQAYKVLNEMKDHSIKSGYEIVEDSKNHLLVQKTLSTGAKLVKSFLIF